MGVAQRFTHVSDEVAACCRAAGRDPREVTVVCVSKTVGIEGVGEAFDAGARHFGENRPDQIVAKAPVYPGAAWHFIGNIQSRRIGDIVGSAALIHSLFQLGHARKIDEAARSRGKVQDVLVEVNVSGEQSKSGIEPCETLDFVRACAALENVRVRGLMTMAPQGDLSVARACFDELSSLRSRVADALAGDAAPFFNELSMGMSEDWREAIGAGATIVRIGRAVFSDAFE